MSVILLSLLIVWTCGFALGWWCGRQALWRALTRVVDGAFREAERIDKEM